MSELETPVVADDAFDASALLQVSKTPLDNVQHLLHKYPVLSPALVLVFSGLVFTYFGDGRFQDPNTIGIMLQQTAVLATLAIGQTLIILTAGIDLSVGTAMLLTHLVIARMVAFGATVPLVGWVIDPIHPVLGLLLGLVLGLLLGAIHGGLVTRFGLPPFIVTLGTFYVYQSIGNVYSKGQTTPKELLGDNTETRDVAEGVLLWLGRGLEIGSMRITVGVLVAIGLYGVFAYILSGTAWGRHVYATGDDAEAARLAGINTKRVIVSVYMVAGLIYAIGAWVQLGRALSASNNAAADINLETITAVVIGGTSLFGGRGRLIGTLVGALIVTMFDTGLSLAGVDAFYKNLAIGLLILFAVALDTWIRKVGK
jgi:fructose transport system permease protein